ncbi:MAG: ATP-binding protein [Bacteroidales bacterium]|nr:ATP-binding protein [Bacteroidales bacterium]
MYRTIIEDLKRWKSSKRRKPLILSGARQTGKTYILKYFGKTCYKNCVYINCENEKDMKDIFSQDYNVKRVLNMLSAISGEKIEKNETLIFLDEIQEIRGGLTSLKYFCEDAPDYHIVVAGSLLGIALHGETSFPVGKVDMMTLYPMTFNEFMIAIGQEPLLDFVKSKDWMSITPLRNRYIEYLRQYYFVGGMPEAVAAFIENADFLEIRTIQTNIITAYKTDISKHAPKSEIQRIELVINNIPSQLAKENKKFVFGALKQGARARDFEIAIRWLQDCGIVHKVCKVSKPDMPLTFYEDQSAFKLYFCDCGLLGVIMHAPVNQILISNNIFTEYKGAFTENFVLQQLKADKNLEVFYYANEKSTLEIDFLVQLDDQMIPIEVKAEENLKAKSLKSFVAKNAVTHGIRFSMSNYMEHEWMTNIPLYAIGGF